MMVNKLKYLAFFTSVWASAASAQEISMNTAQMQAMDKITGRVSIIDIPVNGEIKFGSFSVVVRSCKANPEGEVPENYAFVDVSDKSFDQAEYNIFKGWMVSSNPAIHAVEHPIYDVWLLKCYNSQDEHSNILTPEQLAQRDQLPRLFDVKKEQNDLQENHFEKALTNNIEFKDTMYREVVNKTSGKPEVEPQALGAPENLLNIKDSFEDEEIVSLPAEELSKAMTRESERLDAENEAIQNQDTSPDSEVKIDDDLTSAINEELSQQILE